MDDAEKEKIQAAFAYMGPVTQAGLTLEALAKGAGILIKDLKAGNAAQADSLREALLQVRELQEKVIQIEGDFTHENARAVDAERLNGEMLELLRQANELYTGYGLVCGPIKDFPKYEGNIHQGEWIGKVRDILRQPEKQIERCGHNPQCPDEKEKKMLTMSDLQEAVAKGWTGELYSDEFKARQSIYKDFDHALKHVRKAAAALESMTEKSDHGAVWDGRDQIQKYIADIIISAARLANVCPIGGFIDLDMAVITRLREKIFPKPETRS